MLSDEDLPPKQAVPIPSTNSNNQSASRNIETTFKTDENGNENDPPNDFFEDIN